MARNVFFPLALLSAESLAISPGIKNIDIISFVSSEYTYLIFGLYMF